MIKARFSVSKVNFTSDDVILPAVPAVGNQIFLGDFITEEQDVKINSNDPTFHPDLSVVKHVTWFKNKDEVYLLIELE